jgi:hypothetical protein
MPFTDCRCFKANPPRAPDYETYTCTSALSPNAAPSASVRHPQRRNPRRNSARPEEPLWGGRRVTVALDHYCAAPLVDTARELYHLCRLHPGHTGEHRCAFCPHQWNEPRTER